MKEYKYDKREEEGAYNLISKLDRRSFLKTGMVAGVGLWGISKTFGIPRMAFAQTPKYGGKGREAITESPLTFDPAFMIMLTERPIGYLLYDTLTYITPEGKLIPRLATSWKPVDKGKAWVFYLTKGVRFHNGRAFDANDVAAYFNRVMDPKSGAAVTKRLYPLESADIIDKYTVRINLSKRYADLPILMADEVNAAIIAPESAGRDTKNPIGTGPYKLKQFLPGEKVVFEKNPKYWQKGIPYFDTIEFLNISDPAAQVSALMSGEVDAIRELGTEFIDVCKKQKGIVVEEIPTGGHQNVYMWLDHKPFDDPRVVSAIKNCVDREKFVDLVLNGHGTPANDISVSPNSPYYHGIPIKKQNYKLAKKLLAQAGYRNGIDLELYTSDLRPGMVDTAITLKDMCAPVGIRINIKTVPPETYQKHTWDRKPFIVENWIGRPTIHGTLYQFFHSSAFDPEKPGFPYDKYNTSHYINYTVDELLGLGMTELDFEKRVGYYKMAQAIIMETAGWITPYTANYIRARRKELHGLPMMPRKSNDWSVAWKSA